MIGGHEGPAVTPVIRAGSRATQSTTRAGVVRLFALALVSGPWFGRRPTAPQLYADRGWPVVGSPDDTVGYTLIGGPEIRAVDRFAGPCHEFWMAKVVGPDVSTQQPRMIQVANNRRST